MVKYEEIRQQRLEENKKRMEELNLPLLTQALKNSTSPKPSPMKKTKPRIMGTELVAVRRSPRVAKSPAPEYKEVIYYERVMIPRRLATPTKRDRLNFAYATDEERAASIEKAEKLEASLGSDYPALVRTMLPSHVSGGFWLGLPSNFCRKNLPRRDDTITLIDEMGEEFPTVYLAQKNGLSGGWKRFAVDHDLADGDCIVFHLIRPTKFKVYIIRVGNASERESTETTSSSEAF
ncbi:B3 domain-containing protein [Capsicum chinense]|uniref:B3 domain-containing protein n=1 Tax=Capsicum annuum TaxID=4072 RepID=A0A1U8GC90_CAPAN|nr:B3 domain-containing protein At5g42700 [Capsicum annuum]KAF3642778.1 B3 domain-containing protein [Capsicum annuum]PHT84645.1 B3 domain-containing protein [Capsicum annuum]PHU18867.1 B3 domain-containing protein [Capsicum chinense]